MIVRRTRVLASVVLFASALGCTSARTPQSAATPHGMEIFLLVGQSNMAGRGRVEPEDRATDPRVHMLDRDERWVPAADPMHFDKPIAGVGPGHSFGLAVAAAEPGETIGLVPAAVGGSAITSWVPGGVHAETGAHPYDDAIHRARAALRDGELKAILWHQGESDANPQAAPLYAQRLRELIERFRNDLGAPDVPVLIGELGRFAGKPWDAPHVQIDSALRQVAAEVPNVVYVSSEGLEDRGDTLHFSAAAARAFGRRYAEAYLRLRTAANGR
jgi:hypothetical protein